MSIAFLFMMATIVVVVFVFTKIADPKSELKVVENSIESKNIKEEWNIGALLLRLGPVFTGFGLVGYLATQWWDQLFYRLILIAMLLIGSFTGSFLINYFAPKSKNLAVLSEGLLLIGAFLVGALLNTANDLALLQTGSYALGIGELLGLWFVLIMPIAYITGSTWSLSVSLIINLVWLSTYLLTPDQKLPINLARLFNIPVDSITLNPFLYFILPVIAGIALILSYAWHQTEHHNIPQSGWRPFYYLTGLMAYLTIGALVFRGVVENFPQFQNDANGLIADLVVAILTLGVFLIDYICKRNIKNYNINYLAPVIIFVAAILGPLIFPMKFFIGFYFLEIVFIVWLLADFLRQNSKLAQILFYGFNAIQLFAISTNPLNYNWFRLLVILAIIMYASVLHYKNRSLVFYTVIAGILALVFKIFATGTSGYILIMVIGLVLMAFGFYYTQTRSKMMKEQPKV
jgi:hypothetical protein